MKQIIKIFSKSDAYRNAHEQINKLMNGIFKAEIENGQISIEKYTDTTMVAQIDYCTETAVVVLDARQTRILITPKPPYHRDNLTHWAELQKLSDTTKPKGSIIIVIYGDDHSREMEEDDILHDKWRNGFKYSDGHAEYPLLQDRCFSLWKVFSDLQKRKLRNYMHEIALFPRVETKSYNILVVGIEKDMQEFNKYLNHHPFLHVRQVNSNNSENISQLELFKPSYRQVDSGETHLKLHYYDADIASIVGQSQTKTDFNETTKHVDDKAADKASDEEWCLIESTSEDNGDTSGHSNKTTPKPISTFSPVRPILPQLYRTILLCGDGTVFEKVRNPILRNSVEKYFDAKNIKLSNDILPVRVGDRQISHGEKNYMAEIIKNFIKHDYRENYGDLISILESHHINDYKWMLKMYIMYLCHAKCQDIPTDNGESGFCHLERETKTSKDYDKEKSKCIGGESDRDDAGTNIE